MRRSGGCITSDYVFCFGILPESSQWDICGHEEFTSECKLQFLFSIIVLYYFLLFLWSCVCLLIILHSCYIMLPSGKEGQSNKARMSQAYQILGVLPLEFGHPSQDWNLELGRWFLEPGSKSQNIRDFVNLMKSFNKIFYKMSAEIPSTSLNYYTTLTFIIHHICVPNIES